jgi:hypothetical protein
LETFKASSTSSIHDLIASIAIGDGTVEQQPSQTGFGVMENGRGKEYGLGYQSINAPLILCITHSKEYLPASTETSHTGERN